MRPRILNILVDGRPGTRTRALQIGNLEFEVVDVILGSGSAWLLLLKALFIPRRFGQFDAVMTSEYFSSFAINFRLLATLCPTPHITVGLNQSRQLLKSGHAAIDGAINRIFGRGDLYIMHSRKELDLFNRIHHLNLEKLMFSHWGFDHPGVGSDTFRTWPRPYVCLVGRNNRDVDLFCQVCRQLDCDGVIVCSSHQKMPQELPGNVHVFRDLDMERAMSCIKHALANLILVKDGERGAGHITAVAAMLLETPQIASTVEVLSDYLIDGYNCLAVPIGDADAIRDAIAAILSAPDMSAELASNGREYAGRWLSHQAATERVFAAVHKILCGESVQAVDPEWLRYFSSVSKPRPNL